ncbi:YraN family protein [Aquihabitans sp. G128]|uniref:YraN family protein n=1 Tax=Aquihabitans sp. G128 TaxID=2849779 RepID=UPI001C213CB8|nr:YraN family protein [Aquihabitans sp. G128]QXC62616.1 YraN family protein [Aquihabitans sp. G128]
MTAARQRLGAAGEDRAAAWYEAAGYAVVARNWRCRDGELDLICAIDRCIVVCEVKTRSSLAFGHPAEAVTATKQRRIRGLAARWLAEGDPPFAPHSVRFDVAAVLPSGVEVIQGAF